MKLSINWLPNNLDGGPDDPHFGTEHEGTYAVLTIHPDEPIDGWRDKIYFSCSARAYSAQIETLLKDIVKTYNRSHLIDECQAVIDNRIVTNKTHYLCPVTYIPSHAHGNAGHPDAETGNILAITKNGIRVLYTKSRTVQLTDPAYLRFG